MVEEGSSSGATVALGQAGPLPSKRGEIGFREDVHGALNPTTPTTEPTVPLPARHPAERDPPPSNTPADATSAPVPVRSTSPSLPDPPRKGLLKRQFGGMHIGTLFFCTVQTAMLIGTIVGWAITAIRIRALVAARPGEGMGSATVFVHVAFCLATLGQVLVLERRVFALRAERWAYKHPGEILPVAHGGRRRGRFGGGSLPIAPWHRPPLPTYASVVADSGARTGDVEVCVNAIIQCLCLTFLQDEIIAAPPPPAYGHTRGSTLLLSGFLRESLRAQRPPSQHSQRSQRPAYARSSIESQHSRTSQPHMSERPDSRSSFFSFESITKDAQRARQLEDSLSKLEGGR